MDYSINVTQNPNNNNDTIPIVNAIGNNINAMNFLGTNMDHSIKNDTINIPVPIMATTGTSVSINTMNFSNPADRVQRINVKNIRIVHNVYQEKYNGSFHRTSLGSSSDSSPVNVSGFGDFIRGCYFLLSFCEKFGLTPNILINHPISLFLKRKSAFNDRLLSIFSNIKILKNNNFVNSLMDNNNNIIGVKMDGNINGDFSDYLCSLPVYNSRHVFTYSICYSNESNITPQHRQFIRNLLEPDEELKGLVLQTIAGLELTPRKYSVIHVRNGDDYLNSGGKSFHKNRFIELLSAIKEYISSRKGGNYLIIADNNEIKVLLLKHFPFMKCIFKPITHLGEGIVLEREKVRNTLIDFYLFSYANSISSYSFYDHGSGFSKWVAITYGIPYICRRVQ